MPNVNEHIVIIDPAIKTPADEPAANIVRVSTLPVSVYQPALKGCDGLNAEGEGIRGIVIFGSRISVNDDLAWKSELLEWLRPVAKSGIPVLGICFGHQLVTHMFGGRVEFYSDDNSPVKGFRSIEFGPNDLWSGEAQNGDLVVSHREIVAEPPGCMNPIGTSSFTNDALRHNSLPIWTFQPHPETTPAYYEALGCPGEPEPKSFEFGNGLVNSFIRYVSGL